MTSVTRSRISPAHASRSVSARPAADGGEAITRPLLPAGARVALLPFRSRRLMGTVYYNVVCRAMRRDGVNAPPRPRRWRSKPPRGSREPDVTTGIRAPTGAGLARTQIRDDRLGIRLRHAERRHRATGRLTAGALTLGEEGDDLLVGEPRQPGEVRGHGGPDLTGIRRMERNR